MASPAASCQRRACSGQHEYCIGETENDDMRVIAGDQIGACETSKNETEYHLLKARERVLISADDWQRFSGETIEIRKMIYTYRLNVLEGE